MSLGLMLHWSVILIVAAFIIRAVNDNFTGLANVLFIGLVLLVASIAGYGAWRQEHKMEDGK